MWFETCFVGKSAEAPVRRGLQCAASFPRVHNALVDGLRVVAGISMRNFRFPEARKSTAQALTSMERAPTTSRHIPGSRLPGGGGSKVNVISRAS